MTSTEHLLLQFDLIVIPDPTIAKYMVESYYEKESKIEKKKAYYNKLIKQPFGVLEAFPPRERYDYERIKNLGKQKWIRKFPPLATCGEEAFARMKNHAQLEYFSEGVEDFALHLPTNLIPSKRVLLLRYKNRYTNLVQSLVMKGINVTSAYPITWNRKEWTPQEEKLANECDVIYFHEKHAVSEWRDRMGSNKIEAVAACHDSEVAQAAKNAGFDNVFYAKKSDIDGLTKTMMQAIDFVKSDDYEQKEKKNPLIP
jgi:uroporphyrinogen-III synthase